MGVYINGVKMGKPYINGVKHNAYINGQKIWRSIPPVVLGEFMFYVEDGGSFNIPVSGVNGGGSTFQSYNWRVDWGDGNTQTVSGTGSSTATIPHTYTDGKPGHYITIKPNGAATQGWFNAFGSSETGQDKANLAKIKALFSQITSLMRTMNSYSHFAMFINCTGLTSIPENLLPATTMATLCYNGIFGYCTSLTSIPENLLPPATLAIQCYRAMFIGCTGLTSIPENLLPVTTMASNCYAYMFKDCTGLTSIPDNLLPATTMASNCYIGMFANCTKLANIGSINAAWFSGKTAQSIMFMNDTAITTPITYADIPTEWK